MTANQNNEPNLGLIIRTVERGLDEIYENLSHLNVQRINDDEIIQGLREQHFGDIAEGYAEWAGLDPDREDPSTLGGVVPDPGDSDTNKLIAESHQIGVVTALIVEGLRGQRDSVWSPYLDLDDTTDAVIDGHVDLTAVARHLVKGTDTKTLGVAK